MKERDVLTVSVQDRWAECEESEQKGGLGVAIQTKARRVRFPLSHKQ
jgi:hypothetical protein